MDLLLTPAQEQKVLNLVPNKYYKIAKPGDQIKIARFNWSHLGMGALFLRPAFIQREDDLCTFDRLEYHVERDSAIDYLSPIETPPGAPADWEPSDEELRAIACPPEPSTPPENYNNAVNEPLSAEEWEAREAKRASRSRPGATGGGSAGPSGGAGSSPRKNRRSTRKNRRAKSRKVSRRH